jgi:hypothetical protein
MKRSTWIMLILLALAGGLYWYLQQPGNLVSKALNAGATPTSEVLHTLISPDYAVNGLAIQEASGQSVSLAKEDGIWMVTAGEKGPADQSAAEAAITEAQALQVEAKVASTTDLAAFGLDQPAYLLTLAIENGTPITIKIGSPTVTDNGYYVQKEDGSVAVVNKYGLEALIGLISQPPFPPTPTPVSAEETPAPTP